MDKNQKTLVALLVILGFVSAISNDINAERNNFSHNSHAMTPYAADKAAFSVSREQNKASRDRDTTDTILNKFASYKKQLSDLELKQLLMAVGFNGQNLKEAWAIAKRESNGRPLAHNTNRSTGDNSYGIFQINMIGDLGPERRAKFDLKSNEDLFNPVRNAQIAFYMSQGGKNWSSWKGIGQKDLEWMPFFPE